MIKFTKRRLKMERRGQAAMEFLMTYGWAILAAIVVIAVLAIYFRPSQLVSTTAIVTAPFNIGSQQIMFSDTANVCNAGANNSCIRLDIKNNGAVAATILGVSVSGQVGSSAYACNNYSFGAVGSASAPASLAPGVDSVFIVPCNASAFGTTSGSTISGNILIVYSNGGLLNLTSTGSIAGKAS
jgi:uncharacterized protein (UPF0333 family)